MTAVGELFCRAVLIERDLRIGALVAAESALHVCCFWSLLGGTVVCSEAGHWVS